jgi:uncharacterized RDD family membrane protein YckC
MVYDALLILALWLVTLFPMVAVSNDSVYGAGVRSVLFLELFAFFAWFWMARGQTLGMLAWRLALRTDSGRPMTVTQATLRFFAAMLSFATLGLGYLWMYLNPARRTWSDLASGTHVVHLPKFK